ncbi:MAG: hypothetical protein K8F32_03770 [Rhodocyclaceae bacterium]|nr:hypothetical protein [Rhodocyclaceae bacterium]
MSKEPIVRANPQTAEDKHPKNYLADWWIYAVLAFFVGGLIFMTYALTLRGDVMSEFGKPGSKTAAPPSGASTPPPASAPASAPAPAEKK